MKMKKLSALILCFTMLLSMSFSAEVYAHEEDIMRTENYQKTKAFVDSGDIYDLGLYSMEDAVRIIGRQDPDFADLCGEPQTVASLAVLPPANWVTRLEATPVAATIPIFCV